MSTPRTFPELLALWKPLTRLAEDIGISEQTVYGWNKRGFIDLVHWDAINRAAKERHGLDVTKDELHAMALAARAERRKEVAA